MLGLTALNARTRRRRPGLRPQHVRAAEAIRDLVGASLQGAQPGSRSLEFWPGHREPTGRCGDIGTADFHVEIGRALYSAPQEYLGCHLDARADSSLVKLFHRGQLVKTHPRQQPGRRVTDPADLPAEKTIYAMRDVASLAKIARRHGDAIGVYAERLLDTDLPWTKMRQVYRLLGLVRRYGPGPAETACQRALDLDVVNVTKIASMLEKATENTLLGRRVGAFAASELL